MFFSSFSKLFHTTKGNQYTMKKILRDSSPVILCSLKKSTLKESSQFWGEKILPCKLRHSWKESATYGPGLQKNQIFYYVQNSLIKMDFSFFQMTFIKNHTKLCLQHQIKKLSFHFWILPPTCKNAPESPFPSGVNNEAEYCKASFKT